MDFFSVFSEDVFLFQALGHEAAPFETKTDHQIENDIRYQNIWQTTESPGLLQFAKLTFLFVFSADFFLFQAVGHEAAPSETKIGYQIENKICYHNISQITIGLGKPEHECNFSSKFQMRYFFRVIIITL